MLVIQTAKATSRHDRRRTSFHDEAVAAAGRLFKERSMIPAMRHHIRREQAPLRRHREIRLARLTHAGVKGVPLGVLGKFAVAKGSGDGGKFPKVSHGGTFWR
jgi:hypothetical protein